MNDKNMDACGEHSLPVSELTLIDYFVVVGYDSAIGLQVESCGEGTGGSSDLTTPPLERCYVASVLAHFPEKRPGLVFSSEIVSLCMPKGLKFFTQNDVPSPSVHTFANIREDGSRLNGCALIYYEEIKDMSLCERMSELQTEHVRALTARDKAIERAHVPPGTVSGGTHTLPRGNKKDRSKRTSYYDACGGAQLFMSKCICVLSRVPIVSAGERIVTSIHSVFTSTAQPPALPLESYIYWILNEVPLPAPGSTLKVGMCGVDIVLQRPGPGELPFFDHSLRCLFDLLTVDKFLRLFTCFLLEHQILLCSKTLSRLMIVAESLCALAFPFRWQLTYVPILPYSQLKFMEAPVPYIMGLCYEDVIPEQIFQSNVCVLDIDTGELDMPEDVPILPDRTEFAREVASVLIRFEDHLLENEEDIVKKREVGVIGTRRREEWSSKRMSRSFDDEVISGILNEERTPSGGVLSRAELAPLPLDDVLKQSEVLARVAAIVRRAGVDVKMENIEKELQSSDSYANSPICRRYFKEMRTNNAIREVFLNRFCWLLYSYEHFVIGAACSDKETFFANRDSMANFDKAAFLSDQPDSNLPFLAAFLETQMFTSFVDAKIISHWEKPDENLLLFDARLQALKERHGLQMVRTPTYEKALPFHVTEDAIAKREEALDYIVPQPHALPGALLRCYDGTFPELNTTLLEGTAVHSPLPSPWKQRHRRLRPKHHEKVGTSIADQQAITRTTSYITDTPKQIAHQNWKFVEQLLKETKGKTKRMLVEKMGKEALQLGHADASVNGLEENTLVASFCDLLERIWAHGLIKKQGKSSLWAHVLHHQELEKSGAIARGALVRNSMLTPDFAPHWSGASSTESTPEGSPRKRSSSRAHSPDPKQVMPPLPTHIAYDLKNVLRMTEIKTDIGYARAFVRLALERKLLHKHLKTILSNAALLQQIYKRYAFVRCDDEKEQFLYHVLSLNAAEFRCFTNTFTKTKMQYRVLLMSGNTRSMVSCPIWVLIAGSLCSTTVIDVKPGVLDFQFDHKNLGVLSTLRIGHSLSSLNNGVPPKWFLDCVMVRNEVTGQTYRFNCGRWFGRGVDDGSLERLLVAEILPQVDPDAVILANGMIDRSSKAHSRSRTPPRARSPSATRSESTNPKSRTRLTEIQQQLGEAVNAIVKHFYSGVEARSELTQLLCAPERGLVSVMVSVFLYGRQDSIWSARFFKQHYPWDYIEKVCAWFFELIRMDDAKKLTREQRSLISHACRLVRKISSNTALGKDGKFQLFILVTVRDHVLSGLLPLMAWTPITAQLYDEPSFLRTPHYLTYLAKLLSSLNEFQFNLENSLTYGIE
uniref:DENN domain-containing protein 5A n=1 Tax=Parascaris univalens TaxID=6257 RepID=A0A914ZSH5_PARUN